ncbi:MULTISPECIES: hypothetical protein [unclassified Mesorhizobium]
MNNGQSVPFDPLASYARLSERVENQGRDIVDLRSNMNTGFRNIEGAVNSLATELRGSSKTQWPVIWSAIGVSFAILLAVGSQALAPIRENVSDVKGALSVVVDKMVTQAEMKWRTDRGAEDRLRTEAAIADIRSGLVPRAEHERVWQNYDQRFADEQRQIDEMKAATASVYNQRDIIRDILERLDRAEHRVPPAP